MAKVILTHEVTGLGVAGDVVEVKNGYARNFLVPKGFAVNWTRGGELQVEQLKKGREARALKSAEEAQALKESLEAALIKIQVKSGAEGRLFGSVRTQDVADAIAERVLAPSTSAPSSSRLRSRRSARTRLLSVSTRTFRQRLSSRSSPSASSRSGLGCACA